MRRQVRSSDATSRPELVWNAFVDLLAAEDYGDLAPAQRAAHLVFWYESEVQNGGHGQFFANQGRARIRETMAALRALGLGCHAQVLERATTLGEYADLAECDAAFHACEPTIVQALESHLAASAGLYVEVV